MWDFSKYTMLKQAVFLLASPFNLRNMFGKGTGFFYILFKGFTIMPQFYSSNALALFLVMKISFVARKKLALMPTDED